MKKSAIVFGATGLIGSFLVEQLLDDARYGEVKVFGRRSTGLTHPKLDEYIIDFEKLDIFRDRVKGDELFCCLGTTIKTAGSEEAFRKVDFEWVRWSAVSAAENGVPKFLVISSVGANAQSSNFYLRTKGEMERAVSELNFKKCVILRPSMLLGPRTEFRSGESIGKFFMRAFSFLVPKRYKAVQAETVARAMITAANGGQANGVVENERIVALGK